MDEDTPYFTQEDGLYIPSRFCRGYWSPDTLNGRIVCGLIGYAMDEAFGAPDLVPVRFTVDMLRLIPSAPLRIETEIVRSGRRAMFTRAQLWSGDAVLAQASAIFVRASANPKGATFQTPNWDVPPPQTLTSRPNPQFLDLRPIPAQPGTTMQDADAAQAASRSHPEGRRYWISDPRRVVGSQDNSAFARLAALADFASPLANGSAVGIEFINTDVTLYLHRMPVGEWFGFEFMKHNALDGIAIGECWLYDEVGPLGTSSVAAIANSPRRAGA